MKLKPPRYFSCVPALGKQSTHPEVSFSRRLGEWSDGLPQLLRSHRGFCVFCMERSNCSRFVHSESVCSARPGCRRKTGLGAWILIARRIDVGKMNRCDTWPQTRGLTHENRIPCLKLTTFQGRGREAVVLAAESLRDPGGRGARSLAWILQGDRAKPVRTRGTQSDPRGVIRPHRLEPCGLPRRGREVGRCGHRRVLGEGVAEVGDRWPSLLHARASPAGPWPQASCWVRWVSFRWPVGRLRVRQGDRESPAH